MIRAAAASVLFLLLSSATTGALAQNVRNCRAINALIGNDGGNLREISIRVGSHGVGLFHRSARIDLPPADVCELDFSSDFGVSLECQWQPTAAGLSSPQLFGAVDGALRRCLGAQLSTPVDPPETVFNEQNQFVVLQLSRAELPTRFDDRIEVQVQQTEYGISPNRNTVWLSIHVPTTNGR